MTISKVTYRKTFNLGSFQSEAIGVEIDLNEGESATQALDTCSQLVNEYHQKTMTEMEQYIGAQVTTIEQQVQQEEPKSLVEQIESCTELKVLESYRLIAKTTPECQAAYDKKLKELKND